MTKVFRRTSPAFRQANNPAPSLAALAPLLPTRREPSADFHVILGNDNPNNVCMVTGKRLHPNLRAWVGDGGTAWTVAPTISLPNGGAAYAVLTPSTIWTTTLTAGGSGYSTAPTITCSGGTLAPGGRYPRYSCIVGGGAVTAISTLEPGTGILAAPTLTFSGPGTGAAANCAITSGVRVITVTNGGSGYTGAPTVTLTGGVTGTNLVARAIAILTGGVVTAVVLLDTGYGYTSAPAVAFSGGGGTGAAATATIGSNLLRAIVVTDAGAQSVAPAVTITGGDGTGATAGSTLATGYTRTANSLIIPAGGTTDVNAQNGLTLPLMDDGEFTLFVLMKKTNAATGQVVMGSGTNAGNVTGGFEVKYLSSAYQVLDYNLQLTAAGLTVPGANGDYIMFVYSVTPVAGESVQPSSAVLQSNKFYTRAGNSAAVSALTGERKAVTRPRQLGVGNCYQNNVTYRTSGEVAEVIAFRRGLSTAEIDAVFARSAARMANRGITIVNA